MKITSSFPSKEFTAKLKIEIESVDELFTLWAIFNQPEGDVKREEELHKNQYFHHIPNVKHAPGIIFPLWKEIDNLRKTTLPSNQ